MVSQVTKAEFDALIDESQELVFIDSGRLSTNLTKLVFDDAELCTPEFANLIQLLLELSGERIAYLVMLSPDPVQYYYQTFGRYPAIKLGIGYTVEEYLAVLHEDPGGSPADAIATRWAAMVLFPSNKSWFVHMLRSAEDNGGHLWIPREWRERVLEAFPLP